MSLGLSPAGLAEVYVSWLAHLAQSPGRLAALATFPLREMKGLAEQDIAAQPAAVDPRFASPDWNIAPWRQMVDGFHAVEKFWELATKDIPGFSPQYERAAAFAARQMLDAFSPKNFIPTNPELLFETLQRGGSNLVEGAFNAMDDALRAAAGQPAAGMEAFRVGQTVAVTKGKVVYRNHLMELIQYAPATKDVAREPVLVLPAWIMKYYILDLSPENSLVRWLVGQGHTVFIASWKNPTAQDRDLGMDDYVRDGALAAIEAVSSICAGKRIHLTGYCLGGTLAMITAALLARNKDDRIRTLTLLAAQGDFTEAGEMMIFVTPSEVSYLENMMWAQGYLDTKQMAGAFQMLRSYDLIWSKMTAEYLKGQRSRPNDLMAWNADATRMPYRMHAEYLERLYLRNEFANGHFTALGLPVAPENITVPVFAVGTEKDHVAPWHSVYKIHLMADSDVTFVLTSGGHNAGIVSEPGHPHRYYRMALKREGEPYKSPDQWLADTPARDGSWWQAWNGWLKAHGSRKMDPAPARAGNATYKILDDAPGQYVHGK